MRTIDQIRLEVEKYLGVKPGYSFQKTRQIEVVECRQYSFYFAKSIGFNEVKIAEYFNMGRSNVLQGIKKIKLKYGYDKVITKAVDDLNAILGNEITAKDYADAERFMFVELIKKLKNETAINR